MDIFFIMCATGLLIFTVWLIWVFCKEWKSLYKNKEE